MKKLVALILTLMLILSFATVSFAASTKGTAVAGTSKSKTATALNPSTWTSDVTLSLPSAEEKLETDVVFVLDGSSSADTDVVRASLSLLNALKTATGDSGAAVNVCVVKFKRRAFKSAWFDLATNFEAIKAALEDKYSGGTNIHAGLLAGKEALEEHQNISFNKKYLVLVSDGSTYLYSKEGNWASDTPFTRSYYTKENYKGFAGGYWDNGLYEPNNYPEVNVARPKNTSDVAAWQAYLKDVEARNQESNGDQYDYHCEYDKNFNIIASTIKTSIRACPATTLSLSPVISGLPTIGIWRFIMPTRFGSRSRRRDITPTLLQQKTARQAKEMPMIRIAL